jgi:nanoRNase/pAp phosphatase (c-di-AMP/oligoRNAs hydrolase)
VSKALAGAQISLRKTLSDLKQAAYKAGCEISGLAQTLMRRKRAITVGDAASGVGGGGHQSARQPKPDFSFGQ